VSDDLFIFTELKVMQTVLGKPAIEKGAYSWGRLGKENQ